jgi:hypothetical protein
MIKDDGLVGSYIVFSGWFIGEEVETGTLILLVSRLCLLNAIPTDNSIVEG